MEKIKVKELLNKLDFKKGNGLIPVIIKEYGTNKVLMLAYMNQEALMKTLETKMMHYWSRSRKKIWLKGETSGHYQYVKSAYADCDYDALLFSVKQIGHCCHLGFSTCFHNKILDEDEESPMTNLNQNILNEVFGIIKHRIELPKPNSYVSSLIFKGEEKILKKVNEEAFEFIMAIRKKDRNEIVHEATDLIFHVLIAIAKAGINIEEIYKEFSKRRKEKALSNGSLE